ncbi:unnamed protein product, partial [Prorocentrum cordatum]
MRLERNLQVAHFFTWASTRISATGLWDAPADEPRAPEPPPVPPKLLLSEHDWVHSTDADGAQRVTRGEARIEQIQQAVVAAAPLGARATPPVDSELQRKVGYLLTVVWGASPPVAPFTRLGASTNGVIDLDGLSAETDDVPPSSGAASALGGA